MTVTHNDPAYREIGRLFQVGTVAGLGDRALLGRFVARRDEGAFEALVARHGPMVLGVCRRMLDDPHEADDAFQATFLVLMKRAAALRDADRLGPWLHGVALRVARRARARADRRTRRERSGTAVEPQSDAGRPEADLSDLRPILDAELARLSAKHRDVLVLCLLEGLTAEEAADRLALPSGTVKSRLARGREALRGRLAARGVVPTIAAAFAAGAGSVARAASVPDRLVHPLLRALADPSGFSALGASASLAREVIMSMSWKPVKVAAILLGGLALGAIGVFEGMRTHALAQDAPAPISEVPRKRVATTSMHLKEILLGLHNFYSTNDHFPTAGTIDQDGRSNLSWRVALLPYLDQNELYNQFHLNEPWDSPHNLALAAKMPAVYETPESPAPAGQTRIRGLGGPGSAFEGNKGVTMASVTDGLSNTAIVAVAQEPVSWTKPETLDIPIAGPIPALVQFEQGGAMVGMMDGRTQQLAPMAFGKDERGANRIHALISRNRGEVIPQNFFQSVAPAPTADSTPPTTPPLGTATVEMPPTLPTGAPQRILSVEPGRLEAIEAKLDLILKRLDAMEGRPAPATPAGAAPRPF